MSLEQSRLTLILQEKKRRAGAPADDEFERTFKRLKKQVAKGDDDFRNAIIDGEEEVQEWFDQKVAQLEDLRFPPVDWAADVQGHGFYHKRTQELSPALETFRSSRQTKFRGQLKVVMDQEFPEFTVPDKQMLTRGDFIASALQKQAALQLITAGQIHSGITLGRVGEVEHPAFRLAQLSDDEDAFTMFANTRIQRCTVLGAITGNVMTSGEFEEALTNDLSSERPKVSAYDLNGCRSDFGGWIQSNDEDDGLCVDDNQARNELSFIQVSQTVPCMADPVL